MQQLLKNPRTVLFLGTFVLFGLGLVPAPGGPGTAHAQAKKAKKAPPKNDISPPPADINDLSMEVAALRTLYLLKAGPFQLRGAKRVGVNCEIKPRKRQEAEVSPEYRKVLAELRAAFIANQEDRIQELSDQLEELTKEEDPDLDDEIEIVQAARERARKLLPYFDPDQVVKYLAAYDRDFPSPRDLLSQTIRLDGKGKKPTPEQWEKIRAFVIREVSWMLGGINLETAKPQKIGAKVADLLDRAYALSDEDLKKQQTKLQNEINRISYLTPTLLIKHIINQDLAVLLSNPRLVAAAEARLKHLTTEEKRLALEEKDLPPPDDTAPEKE